jgi:hypothetical protein
VFELFGLPRPSQTQEMRAVTLKQEEETAAEAEAAVTTRTTEEYNVATVVPAAEEAQQEAHPAPMTAAVDPSPTDFAAFASDMKAPDVTYQAPRLGLRRRLRQKLVSLRTTYKKGTL